VAGTVWHKLPLINGWKSAQQYQTGDPAYTIKGGVVYLSGSLRQPAGSNRESAVLPKAARPTVKMYVRVFATGGAVGSLVIWPSGVMQASSSPPSNAREFTSLAAISYPAAGTTWHKLALANGWKPGPAATGYPAYTVKGAVVYLSGSVQHPLATSVSGVFAIPPTAVGPVYIQALPTYTFNGTPGNVYISSSTSPPDIPYAVRFADADTADPAVRYWSMAAASNPQGNAQRFTSLAAISYPSNS
jgi:hypothetical protein